MENEVCPILVGFNDEEPKPNPEEVEATRWVEWPEFLQEIKTKPGFYSEWCKEEAHMLAASSHFADILARRET